MASASNPRVTFALLQYYLREKLWRHAESVAQEMHAALSDFTFLLWKAYALDRQGAVADALREYKLCEGKRGVNMAALIGMQLIFKRNNDTEALTEIDAKLQKDEQRPNQSATIQAAALLWHAGELSRAREVVSKVLDNEPEYRDEYTSVLTVRAWIDLSARGGAMSDKCLQLFDRVLQAEAVDNLVDVDALLGKVAVLERKNQFWPAQELLNKCLVAHRTFVPAVIVKIRQLLRIDDWDQAADLTTSVLANDPLCVEALVLSALNLLVRESRVQSATRTIADLIKALQMKEPRNGLLYLQCAQCFSRLAATSSSILALTASLAESAAQLMPHSSDAASEVAYQAVLRGDHRTAMTLYKKASTQGDGNVVPLVGIITCAIAQGNLVEASKQLDFLNEISSGQQKNYELLFLGARLAYLQKKDNKTSIELLDRAVEAHRQDYAAVGSGADLYIRLNPQLVLQMAREYAQHCRTEPGEGSRTDPLVEKTRKLLDQLLRIVPGSTDAQLLNSRMAFVSGDIDRASALIAACLRQDQSLAEAHLLQANIMQHAGNFNGATQALELALSYALDINETPSYNLLRGTLLYHKGDYENALTALKFAITAVGQSKPAAKAAEAVDALGAAPAKPAVATGGRQLKGQLTPGEHVSLYLQLAQTYIKMRDATNAKQTVREALMIFADTPHVGRVQIAQALLVARQDADQAFSLLRSVPPSSPHFLAAKAHMAQLYLSLRGNRRAFARCYEEVVEAMPSVQSFMHLGDAYAGIQEPDKAIVAYEKARAMDPNNAELSVKIGRTLVTTHDYQRALRYYRDAVVSEPHLTNLRADLAGLYWRLGDIEKAVQTLREAPVMRRPPAQDELPAALERVQLTLMQAKIYKDAEKTQNAVDCLIQARVYQNGVVHKARNETPETIAHEKTVAANICLEIGDHHNNLNDHERALHFYTEALKHDETSSAAMLNLARLYLKRGENDHCETQCNALLRVQPACEEAIVMLADLAYNRGRYEDAAYHFLQLLEKQPDNFSAMVHYVQLLRRSGHLNEAPRVFETAEKTLKPGQRVDPGFAYARGLYHKFSGNTRDALTHLNQARVPRGNPWMQKALAQMIDIYIHPSNVFLWEDVEARPEVEENLRTAERLVVDIEDPEKRRLLQAYTYAASKRRDMVEKALTMFQDLNEARIVAAESSAGEGGGAGPAAGRSIKAEASSDALGPSSSMAAGEDKDGGDRTADKLFAPAVVGMAIAHQILKQSSKARTFLKRLNKPNFNEDEEDDYERGYLLLASIYIENGKHDLAQGLLNKAIAANKSCARAWELLGLIYEREQAYKDASDSYERAWSLQGERDPAIGFKLAFNYLKAKRNVQAIDVCDKVLEAHPTYPKIRKEILERARLALRP